MIRDIGECFGDGPEGEGPNEDDAQCAGGFYDGQHYRECPQRDACQRDYEQRQEKLEEDEARRADAAGFSTFYEPPEAPTGQLEFGAPAARRASTSGRAQEQRRRLHHASVYSPDDTHSFLAVDEPPPEGGAWKAHLGAIVLRSMFKAACLSLAHFFNNHPFRKNKEDKYSDREQNHDD